MAVAAVAVLVEILRAVFLVLVRVAAVMDQILLTHQMELPTQAAVAAVLDEKAAVLSQAVTAAQA